MIPEVRYLLMRGQLQVQGLANVADLAPPQVPVLVVRVCYLEQRIAIYSWINSAE